LRLKHWVWWSLGSITVILKGWQWGSKSSSWIPFWEKLATMNTEYMLSPCCPLVWSQYDIFGYLEISFQHVQKAFLQIQKDLVPKKISNHVILVVKFTWLLVSTQPNNIGPYINVGSHNGKVVLARPSVKLKEARVRFPPGSKHQKKRWPLMKN